MTNVERGEEIPTAQPKAHSTNVGRSLGLRFLRWVFLRHRWQRIRSASGLRNAGAAEVGVGNVSWSIVCGTQAIRLHRLGVPLRLLAFWLLSVEFSYTDVLQ